MHGRLKWGIESVAFMIFLLWIPINCYAYSDKSSDFVLTPEKPEDKTEGHYLEFVSEKAYTVQNGDTLWGIAGSYWGSNENYQEIISDNPDLVKAPELLIPGTELVLKSRQYARVGIEDFIASDVFEEELRLDAGAFDLEKFSPPYRIFASSPYLNDLQDADPYVHWEEFQEEIRACSKEICGERVTGLTFERYQVTGIGHLCGYRFDFDAGDQKYIVMAYFCYNDTTKSEAFALCDQEWCTEKQIEEAKGKAACAAVRYLDPGVYYEKTQDYTGAEDWNYPQLRNPFADAMVSLYSEPLGQAESYQDDVMIQWKEPAFEKAVREELAALWQLAPQEKQDFMKRDMTVSDLRGIERLSISYYSENTETEELLSVQLNGCKENGAWGARVTGERSGTPELFCSLEDVSNFRELRELHIKLRDSNITDLSWIGALTDLRILDCDIASEEFRVNNVDFLGNLPKLRTLSLGGFCFGKYTKFYDEVTDLSVLSNCPHLAYLTLYTGNVESYAFLRNLPEIYYLRLSSRGACKREAPDVSLLPNACFIEIYGYRVRINTGGGYGEKSVSLASAIDAAS